MRRRLLWWVGLLILAWVLPVESAIKVHCEARNYQFTGTTMAASMTCKVLTNPAETEPLEPVTVTGPGANAASAMTALRNKIIVYAQNRWGVTVTAEEITITGGLQ